MKRSCLLSWGRIKFSEDFELTETEVRTGTVVSNSEIRKLSIFRAVHEEWFMFDPTIFITASSDCKF